MSKKLLSTLIASLFAAAPAFAQSDDDPMRVQGTATLGGIYNNTNAFDNAQLYVYQDLGNGALSNVGVQGRNSKTWFQGYGENFGRTDQYMFLRGGMYDVFKAGAYLNDIPHTFSSNAYSPYIGIGGNVLTATFPLARCRQPPAGQLEQLQAGLRPARRGRLRRVAEEQPVVLPRRRQPGHVQRHQGRLRRQRHEPGQRLHRPRDSRTDYTTSNWGVEGGYQTGKATFAAALGLQQVRQRQPDAAVDEPVLRRQPARHDLPSAEQHVQQVHALGQLPRPAVAVGDLGALHVGEDDERRRRSRLTALDYRRRLQPHAARTRPTSTARTSTSRSQLAWTATPAANVDTRVYYYWTKLREQLRRWSSSATRRRSRSRAASAAATSAAGGRADAIAGNCENELYNYTKNNVGFDVWWKFARGPPAGLRLGLQRPRPDARRLRQVALEQAVGRVQEHDARHGVRPAQVPVHQARRDAQLQQRPLPDGGREQPELPAAVHVGVRPAEQHDEPRSSSYLDWTPMPNVGVSFEGNWAKIDYDDVTFGRTSTDRQGYFLSGNWNASEQVKLNAFGSWEQTKYPSEPPLHRHGGGRADAAVGLLHGRESELLRPVRAAVPAVAERHVLQLEFADQGHRRGWSASAPTGRRWTRSS